MKADFIEKRKKALEGSGESGKANVITSYSIHYTKLYDLFEVNF